MISQSLQRKNNKDYKVNNTIESIELTYEVLEGLTNTIGNEFKPEINYIYVDKENVVATDSRRLYCYPHKQEIETPFFVEGALAKEVVKNNKKAEKFILSENNIMVLKKSSDAFFMQYGKTGFEQSLGGYPDYKRIIPTKPREFEIPFVNNENISGILAVNGIHINPKFIPNFKKGYIMFSSPDTPVLFTDGLKEQKYLVMPIIDTFKELENYMRK